MESERPETMPCEFGERCDHGLKRQCEVCELRWKLATLTAERDRLRDELEAATHYMNQYREGSLRCDRLQAIVDKLPKWMMSLAADFLDEYADMLGNGGCCDYDAPVWVPLDELVECVVRAGMEPGSISLNWAVVFALAEAIRAAASEEGTP